LFKIPLITDFQKHQKFKISPLLVDTLGSMNSSHMLNKAYFVKRAKDNMRFWRIYSKEVDGLTGIIYDQLESW